MIRQRLSQFKNRVYRSKGGLWLPELDLVVPKHRNILAVLGRPDGDVLIPASNIITNAGDVYYAQSATGAATTNAFGSHYVATAASVAPNKASVYSDFTVTAGSEKAVSATYPKNDDADVDNTGSGEDIVTWKFEWTKADFSENNITHGLIGVAAAAGASPLLTAYAFSASFNKTADDTLTIYVNHEMLGV